jgi:hypothetical protein
LQAAAIGQLDPFRARFGVANLKVGKSHFGMPVGIWPVGAAPVPTNIPTFTPDTNKRRWTPWDDNNDKNPCFTFVFGRFGMLSEGFLVPLAGIEPALLAELDFESSASTNSATGAQPGRGPGRGAEYSARRRLVNRPKIPPVP